MTPLGTDNETIGEVIGNHVGTDGELIGNWYGNTLYLGTEWELGLEDLFLVVFFFPLFYVIWWYSSLFVVSM
jgi:hypothetical protein